MAPDDLVPQFDVDCEKKENHPQCVGPPPTSNTASVLFTDGFNPGWEWMDWEIGNAPDLLVDLLGHNSFETDLDLSDNWFPPTGLPLNGDYGPCIYEPADTDPAIIIALAEQLDGITVPAGESLRNTRISVEAGQFPGTSLNHFVRFLYLSPHTDLQVYKKGKNKGLVDGDVGFQVGGYWNHFGDPMVTRTEEGDTFTFTGGTVSVAHRNGPEPRLQCPLVDVVVVSVKMN